MYALEKIRVREDFSNIALNYFPVKDTKFAKCYFDIRFTIVCIMFMADPLFQNVEFIQKMSRHFETIIFNL